MARTPFQKIKKKRWENMVSVQMSGIRNHVTLCDPTKIRRRFLFTKLLYIHPLFCCVSRFGVRDSAFAAPAKALSRTWVRGQDGWETRWMGRCPTALCQTRRLTGSAAGVQEEDWWCTAAALGPSAANSSTTCASQRTAWAFLVAHTTWRRPRRGSRAI